MDDTYIKKLQPEDAAFLSEVARKAYSDHYLDLWYDEGKWYTEKYFSTEQLSAELNDKNSCFFIAFHNEIPIGFLKLNIDAPLPVCEEQNALELERIYLKKEATGKGIGKQLMQLTESIAKEYNKDLIWLKAMDTSEGPISFYKKMGFEIKATHRLKHPLMKEELRGMVIMIKTLKDK